MIRNVQGKLREGSRSFGLLLAKIISGLFIGLTVALIFRQVTSIGDFAFTFIIVLFIGAFIKMSQKWKFTGVLLFNLFCVMTAMLLRMYILIAPG